MIDPDLLEVHMSRLDKPDSKALPRQAYGDPANAIKFDAEREEEYLGTKEIERILRVEIDNWIAWGRMRDFMPVGFKSQLGQLYKSTDVIEVSYKPIRCNEITAADFERIVINLPYVYRNAFVMYQLGKVVAQGKVRAIKGYQDSARLLGVSKSKYYALVQKAHLMVLRCAKTTMRKKI